MPDAAQPTRTLARYAVSANASTLPAAVQAEAVRTTLNWLGCAIGAARHDAVEIAVATVVPFAGPPQATLAGRPERLDILNAALINGIASHVFDFDDTHADTLIHPAGPVVSAAAALAEYHPVDGPSFLAAVVIGIEAACRIGRAVLPDHYARGWHITGSAGSFGAAVAAGRLLGLDEQRMAWAIGLAAAQPVGLREMFGSMTKSFHPGRAAQNGMLAALLAQRGFTSSEAALEAKRGWAAVTSNTADLSLITAGLGERFEITRNTYKPFACGLVMHPVIDGCIHLRQLHAIDPATVAAVALRVHPLVLELTGKTAPATGLDGKFSITHAAATALLHGRAGEREFTTSAVQDPAAAQLRTRVTATADPGLHQDAAHVRIDLIDGRVLEHAVADALGSLERPLGDAALDAKFIALAEPVLPGDHAAGCLRACRALLRCADVGAVMRLAGQAGLG